MGKLGHFQINNLPKFPIFHHSFRWGAVNSRTLRRKVTASKCPFFHFSETKDKSGTQTFLLMATVQTFWLEPQNPKILAPEGVGDSWLRFLVHLKEK